MNRSLEELIPGELLNPSESFKEAMETMSIHWWYWDAVNKKLMINPGLLNLLGYTIEEFDPSIPSLDKNIHPEDSKENVRVFNAFLNGEVDVYEIEYRLLVDGNWVWYYNRGAIMARDPEGNPLFAGGITMDISTRYSSLLTRVEEGDMFEFIFKNTGEAVFIVSFGNEKKPARIKAINSAAATLFACNQDELIGKNPNEIFNLSIENDAVTLRQQLLKSGSFNIEIKTKDFKGKNKYLQLNAHAFIEHGEDLFIALVSDRTESYKFKKELKASEQALLQSEKIYHSLIQAANDRIGLFDTEANPIIINNAFAEVLGYTMEEYMELEVKEQIHPEDHEKLLAERARLFKTGSLTAEYRVRHRNGHYLHMNSKSVLLRKGDLDKDYILFIIRDVTDRIKFQKELLEAKESAIESDKLKSAFLANMSHEIRTPMNSIVGFANLLSEDDIDENSKKEYVRRINRNSSHLLALISDIIDLAKIESNQLSVVYSRIYLNNLFSDLANYGKQQLKLRENAEVLFKFNTDENSKELFIESDLIRLTQIMQNLVNNAVKFTSKGEISIGYKKIDANKVRLYVRDTGTGIDRKNFEIIFDQFRQIDGSNIRKYGGTGLGLAICKNLSHLLSGKIWVESENRKGSTFFVELPIRSGFSIESKNREIDTQPVISKKTTVLVVDDDPDTLMLLVTLMRNEGIQTIIADSGYKALEIMEKEDLPDIVLLDLQMPVMSGVQTLKIIKDLYPEQKVIAQSAHALEGQKDRTIYAGFDEYISKPYSKQGLLEVIKKVLNS